GSDDGASAAPGIRHEVKAVVEWDSFCDDDDEFDPPFDRFDCGVFRIRRRNENDGGVRPPSVHGFPHAVEDRDPLDLRPAFARGDPGDHLCAEVDHQNIFPAAVRLSIAAALDLRCEMPNSESHPTWADRKSTR